MLHSAEQWLIALAQGLKLLVEFVGVVVVGAGVLVGAYQFLRLALGKHSDSFNRVRLEMARYLALGLEFQLGADILSTAIAPSWEQIGKLGAIAVIRTLLNFFLIHEMRHEKSGSEVTQAGVSQSS